jgi:glucose-6-phosphate dehydrogenase assembly protein OpcA
VAATLTSVRAVQRELRRLIDAAADGDAGSGQRTSVMTHVAWVPREWREAAEQTLAGLGEAHPSRTILLYPEPEADADALEAEVDLRFFVRSSREICSEVITIRLLGPKASVPASIVLPLLRSDLPAFLRWRGLPPFGSPPFEQLVDISDRLIVDSSEWPDPAGGYMQLAGLFDRIAVSDIAWARTGPWREAVAALWPAIAEAEEVRVRSPLAESLLIARWLSARLGRNVRLRRLSGEGIELVEVDRCEARPDPMAAPSSSDLLSAQLEIFGRDAIYEEAVCSFTSPRISRHPRRRGSRSDRR